MCVGTSAWTSSPIWLVSQSIELHCDYHDHNTRNLVSTDTETTASAPASTTSSSCAIYKVATGDTCISIATSKGISVSQIEQWNPNKCGKGLQAGDELCIPPPPVSSITASAISTGPMPTSTTCAAGTCCKYCKVAPGDSCDSIASVEDIFSSRIEQWNPDSCGPGLKVGAKLCVEGPAAALGYTASTGVASSTIFSSSGSSATGSSRFAQVSNASERIQVSKRNTKALLALMIGMTVIF